LQTHDYARPGAYFVTTCTSGRECLFGDVVDGIMLLSDLGQDVSSVWNALPERFPGLALDHFIVMPNHVHGILVLGTSSQSISVIVRVFKSLSAHRLGLRRTGKGALLWQRGFYDHVIRDDADLARIREYVDTNPARWSSDEENPARALAAGT
jgi:REP element-mobilizing transposase RayT